MYTDSLSGLPPPDLVRASELHFSKLGVKRGESGVNINLDQ